MVTWPLRPPWSEGFRPGVVIPWVEFIILRGPETPKGKFLRIDFSGRAARIAAGFACAFLLAGCLYTGQHFNDGRLLAPGNTSFTLGAGMSRQFSYGCPEVLDYGYGYNFKDSTGLHCVHNDGLIDPRGNPGSSQDTVEPVLSSEMRPKASLGYRLGVAGRLGPFPGADIGLRLEAPTNPVSAEFDLRLGLPAPRAGAWRHSLSGGWIIGAWADNSWFAEYAWSHDWGGNAVFANYRATNLATQFADLADAEGSRRFASRRRLIHQVSLGWIWNLPAVPVLPDYLAPAGTLTYPLAPDGFDAIPDRYLDDHAFEFALGIGWRFP
jgi:hypothetical protein